MLSIDRKIVNSLVEEVIDSITKNNSKIIKKQNYLKNNKINNVFNGLFDDVDNAISAASKAQELLIYKHSIETRNNIIKAIRKCSCNLAIQISNMAVEETGIGRIDDKIKKNYLAANKTPGCEILKTWCQTGDYGLVLTEKASFGVIGAITPSTNATETIICNSIGMIAAGNSVIFNVHPSAKNVAKFLIKNLNEAIISVGGPSNLISIITESSIESAKILMAHPKIKLIVVTGGPAVVKAAMNSGKRAICGGPGNPPVVVDETANIKEAAKCIISGSSLDNNIVCVAEKEVFCVSDIADILKQQMIENGAVELRSSEINKLEKLIIQDDHINKNWVGKNASIIAKAINKQISNNTRILLCEVDSEEHPFVQNELLMPILPLIRMPDVDTAIQSAIKCEHNYKHTASMHSTNINSLHHMAKVMDCSIFVKNAPNYSGLGLHGEGYTSFTIASPTGEGLTTAISFTRERRCTLKDCFRII